MTKKVNKYGGGGYGYTRKVNGKWWGWRWGGGGVGEVTMRVCVNLC